MEKNIVKFRLFLWLTLAIIVAWLLYSAIVPSGKISYVYDFNKDSFFINRLNPVERLEPAKNGEQKIIGDPAYFTLRTLRKFNKAKITFKYKEVGSEQCLNPNNCLPIIEAGLLQDKVIWRYALKPLENKIIDQLSLVWKIVRENNLILLQREEKYRNIDEFIKNPPPGKEIALYNHNLRVNYILTDYQPENKENKISQSLRGDYQFYVYLKNEALDMKFKFIDLNKNKDNDEINLNLYYDGNLIDQRSLGDTLRTEGEGKTVDRGKLEFYVDNLPEGIYKVELQVNDDIITKEIITKQTKLSFINKIWLADNGSRDIELFSDSDNISAQTINPAKVQTIKIGEKSLELKETYKLFSMIADNKINTIKLEKDDVILSGNRVFSFSIDSLINLEIKKVDKNLNINEEGVNFVLADYQAPAVKEGWKISQAEFDLTKAYSEKGKYSFIISLPGLLADDKIIDGLILDEITVDLEGKSLWQKMQENFQIFRQGLIRLRRTISNLQ